VQGCIFGVMAQGKILYIGKATSLTRPYAALILWSPDLIKTRGAAYCGYGIQGTLPSRGKKRQSVLEALILEANLIKKHQPYYNTPRKG
jgi:hypothetical protein